MWGFQMQGSTVLLLYPQDSTGTKLDLAHTGISTVENYEDTHQLVRPGTTSAVTYKAQLRSYEVEAV